MQEVFKHSKDQKEPMVFGLQSKNDLMIFHTFLKYEDVLELRFLENQLATISNFENLIAILKIGLQ